MPYIQFPDVPNVAGVPPLLRSLVAVPLALTGGLAALAGAGLPINFLAPVWGIFDDTGVSAFDIESVVGFGFGNASRVSESILERGAFNSYNKTGSPFEARMRVTQGASQARREALLSALENEVRTPSLFTVVTPDATYSSVTLESYDYRRETRNGAVLLIVDLALKEIRQIATAQYSASAAPPLVAGQVQTPSAASPVSLGQVQPVASLLIKQPN